MNNLTLILKLDENRKINTQKMNHGVLFQPDIKAYFMVSYIPRTQDTMKQKKELEYNPDIAKN